MQLDTQSSNPTHHTSHGDPTGKTKETITSFLGRDGEADTTVHETINPAVVREHVQRTNHEERQKIIDREVHQDHHHISIQPVRDQEILPETHETNIAPVETHEIKHGNEKHVLERLAAERSQFRDTRDVAETRTTTSTGPTVAGEHIHHHVHETIQPVVERDILEPHVIHNTFPIHEIHINEAKHHSASSLPEVTLAEFQRQGGTLAGREERVDSFSGAPRSIDDAVTDSKHNNVLGGPGAAGTTTVTGGGLGGSSSGGRTGYSEDYDYGTSGRYESTGGSKTQQRSQYDTTGSTQRGYDTTTGSSQRGYDTTTTSSKTNRNAAAGAGAVGLGGVGTGAGVGAGTAGGGGGLGSVANKIPGANKLTGQTSRGGESSTGRTEESGSYQQGKKPSLIDKLNPMKDTNKDGKAGFMS
ncbi:hypothetical protein V495_03632 [Pseudogymnoascus sp. VKM F-4514 (FW-929)]|nr:hypothetical protein V495_03632 [Pseudogymnoascus sp. VKM F-4514 (FW-929)]KFY56743.1 hypothetical protein V497_06020 [Pseudogymnoascus sp. VKM F-4516 (FW-969)]